MSSNITLFGMDYEGWDDLVISFPDYDVYYLKGYVTAFQIHGDGLPFLVYFERENLRALKVVMMRDISLCSFFSGKISPNTYFDLITPYGYGGFIFDGEISPIGIEELWKAYILLLNEKGIVSDFTRFHPLLRNAEPLRLCSNVIDIGPTISMDLSSKDVIYENLLRNNRNKIRKAQKSGVVINHGHDPVLWDSFIPIYEMTMDKDNAVPYYYFKRDFFESIQKDLAGRYEMFYALLDNKIIAMAIMLYANGKMHYHLSGSDIEYRNFAPTNLLLFEAACWGCDKGLKTLHLGGGVGAGDDSLYKFKEGFNKKSNNMFSIGKSVVNQKVYDYLVDIRKKGDPDFNVDSSFFPLYRCL